MKYLVIENDGLIELDALHLLGASTKRDDEKTIGKYGSGNKYAIAGLLRNNIRFQIFSGTKEFAITTQTRTFRDKEFEVLYIDDERTSITTELGLDWELWHCLREIIANAMDEGGFKTYMVDKLMPEKGKTKFIIEVTAAIDEFWALRAKYFTFFREGDLLDEYKHEDEDAVRAKIYKRFSDHGTRAYKNGILIYESEVDSAYDYEFHNLRINEMRGLGDSSQLRTEIREYFLNKATAKTILEFARATGKDNTLEHELSIYSYYGIYNKEEWIKAIRDRYVIPHEIKDLERLSDIPECDKVIVSDSLEEVLARELPQLTFVIKRVGSEKAEKIEPTKRQLMMIDHALDFLNEVGYNVNSEIQVIEFKNKFLFGQADTEKNIIMIGAVVFDKGLAELIRTILEEWLHIQTKYDDLTREFQNYIFDQFIAKMAIAKDLII